jgi:hypothetical protein
MFPDRDLQADSALELGAGPFSTALSNKSEIEARDPRHAKMPGPVTETYHQ